MGEFLDRTVDWIAARFRPFLYGMLVGILFTIACTVAAQAASYAVPSSSPRVYVPDHGVEVTVAAVQTAVGHGIGVLERSGGGEWTLCNFCLIDPEIPTMDTAVNSAGGPGPYVESKRDRINDVLSRRFPSVMPSGSTMDRVNGALSGLALRLVNGAPQLGSNQR